jgi:hypothetical protein
MALFLKRLISQCSTQYMKKKEKHTSMTAASWGPFLLGDPISVELEEDENAWWPSAGVMSMDPSAAEEPGIASISLGKDPEGVDTGTMWDNEYGKCARTMALEVEGDGTL